MKPVRANRLRPASPRSPTRSGLPIIFSATVLNLCLHKLEPKHLYSLPSFVVEPYEQAGSMGVTLVLAGVGLFIMVLGYLSAHLSGRSTRSGAASHRSNQAEDSSLFRPADCRSRHRNVLKRDNGAGNDEVPGQEALGLAGFDGVRGEGKQVGDGPQ